ncbi:MAG: hypothetical protein AUG51_04945 [Acidobacteria bacterium 13_1_20CM_3_53_8]|nr:MAG: hypothetical protein AUG51_04945 [Acidobacteria bacterium 13_1_20CM_3_53_8]
MTEAKENSVCQGEDVAAYLDGEMDGAESLRFEEHMVECASCRTRLREQRSLLCTLDVALNDKRSLSLPIDFAHVVATHARSNMGGVLDRAERKRALLWCAILAASSFILLGTALRETVVKPAASIARQIAIVCDIAGRATYDAGSSFAVISRSVGWHLLFESHFFGAFALLVLIISIALLPGLIIRPRRAKIM